jgi:hypothetical protein
MNRRNQETVKLVLRGIYRSIGTARAGKAAATANIVRPMLEACPENTLIGLRDRALLSFGLASAMRRNERERIDRLVREFTEIRKAADAAAQAALEERRRQIAEATGTAEAAQIAQAEAEADVALLRAALDTARQDAADALAVVQAAQIGRSELEAEIALLHTDLDTARGLEAERKGRGRWARLRAAWRGE